MVGIGGETRREATEGVEGARIWEEGVGEGRALGI